MAKKKGSKVRKKRHLLILEIGGVAVLAALVAGLVLYRNVFRIQEMQFWKSIWG